MENKFDVKVGDIVKVSGGYPFDPSIGKVTWVGNNLIQIKITSAQNDTFKARGDYGRYYWSFEIVEVISRVGELKAKPQSGKRISNSRDVYFVVNTNAPSGKEITFDFYPTDEELHAILSLTIQSVLSVSEPSANTLLEHSTPDMWAMLLASYVDDAIDKVIGGQDLYEIYYEQEHGH